MSNLKRTARTTGAFYAGLAITGMLGFLGVRGQLYDADNPSTTLTNLTDNPTLAQFGVAAELGIVLTQALAAVWFYKLFRAANPVAAGAIAAFGLVNATAILGSSAFLMAAVAVADDTGLAPAGDAAATVQLMYTASDGFWAAGTVFFGLWLIPMGYVVAKSALMPRLLGWLLMIAGVGYVTSAFTTAVLPDSPTLSDVLTFPASVGEFWMIGYLLVVGVRTNEYPATIGERPPAKAAR